MKKENEIDTSTKLDIPIKLDTKEVEEPNTEKVKNEVIDLFNTEVSFVVPKVETYNREKLEAFIKQGIKYKKDTGKNKLLAIKNILEFFELSVAFKRIPSTLVKELKNFEDGVTLKKIVNEEIYEVVPLPKVIKEKTEETENKDDKKDEKKKGF